MQRRHEKIFSPAIGQDMDVLAYGHYGAPIIAFPSGGGRYFDFENNEMIHVLSPLIEGGKIKIYCPPSMDNESWLNSGLDPHWRASIYNNYQSFIVDNLVPTIKHDCNSQTIKIGLVGCSLGAFHTANLALKFPHQFDYALGMSGRYDLEKIMGHSSDSEDVYFNNPMAFVPNLNGEALDHIRYNTHIALVCGQGAWEEKCLDETHRLADMLAQKSIRHEKDIWGEDVEHHWHWWRKQVVHHLGKRYG